MDNHAKWIIRSNGFRRSFIQCTVVHFLTERQQSIVSNYAMLCQLDHSSNHDCSQCRLRPRGVLLLNDVLFLVHDEVELGLGNLTAQAAQISVPTGSLQNFSLLWPPLI